MTELALGETYYSRASDAIHDLGWGKHRYVNDEGKVCLVGALGVAVCNDPKAVVFGTGVEIIDKLVGEVNDLLQRRYNDTWMHASTWNDQARRTVEDVHELLRELHMAEMEHVRVPDFRGNDYGVGDTVVYSPTDRFCNLVEAIVVEIGPVVSPNSFPDSRRVEWVKVRPIMEAHHWGHKASKRSGRMVKLTNLGRIMAAYGKGEDLGHVSA